MKKSSLIVAGLVAFTLGMSVDNFALSNIPASYRVAVVDISQVVASSAQVKALKEDQQKKANEMVSFIEKARKDIAAVSDEKKKKQLEDKYSKEIQTKRDKLEKDYASKLTAIDNSISKTIETQAKAKNYDVVLAKGVVLYGGDDLTSEIIKAVK